MSAKDGGAAFPMQFLGIRYGTLHREDTFGQEGMSLRDYFAAAAMQGMLSGNFVANQASQSSDETFNYAIAAFALANAMLEARKQ